jgi:anti-anti-sigma factor
MTTVAPPQSARRADHMTLSTEWLNPSVVRISASGDIDACNSAEFAEYVFTRAANCQRLILDMAGVEFFSTAGFARLRTIEIRCTRAKVEWTLVASRAVTRVLTICDPRCSLPVEAA